jgi:hypothetical protein
MTKGFRRVSAHLLLPFRRDGSAVAAEVVTTDFDRLIDRNERAALP